MVGAPQHEDCVEVATCPHTVQVRDSKGTTRPSFAVSPTAWGTFVRTADSFERSSSLCT
ncbi:DUF397 domain-containing protein [Streptomyces sp. NBC_00239]|nr:DUF397 domain-containing protein [Streptomyces sp. NBC_00239]